MQLSTFYFQAIAAAKTGKIRTGRVSILSIMVGLAVLSTASLNINAALAGQPVSPPPPPVKFALTIAPAAVSVSVDDMSDFGELVGAHNTLADRRAHV